VPDLEDRLDDILSALHEATVVMEATRAEVRALTQHLAAFPEAIKAATARLDALNGRRQRRAEDAA
jgi:DNA repair ATPase RecN